MSRAVLVDTSVWIDYLRNGRSKEAQMLDQMLGHGLVVTCDPVKAEIVSGVTVKPEFEKMKGLLDSLPALNAFEDIWIKIAQYRFLLARKGIQASLIDLWIAVVAQEHAVYVWTLDKDFHYLNTVVPFDTYHPKLS